MIVDGSQRWRLGRSFRRPQGPVINPAEYEVAAIEDWRAAAGFVEEHHYAGTASPAPHRFGLYHHAELVGVALFGPPASMAAHRKVFPTLDPVEAVTLGRLVLLDCVPGNAESWFVARCFELLARPDLYRPLDKHGRPRRPIIAVESCADPVVRTALDGTIIAPGHAGTVYQSLGARHIGRTRPERLLLLPDGSVFSRRAASKITGSERGWERAVTKLVRFGAPPLAQDADRAERQAWVRRIRSIARLLRHPGCFRYTWAIARPVDRRDRARVAALRAAILERHPALPYPKIDVERMTSV